MDYRPWKAYERSLMTSRSYSSGTRAALVAFSASKCYWRGCGEPLLRKVNGQYRMALEIAHICALNPDGPRYDSAMTDGERNDFPNLIYLCSVHHRVVDENDGKDYPVAELRKWKAERETTGQAQLTAESPVTVEFLEKVITTAITDRDEHLRDILSRLERTDTEAAAVVRELLEELRSLRGRRPIIDPDAAMLLARAARDLRGMEEWTRSLDSSVKQFGWIRETVERLESAVRRLQRDR